MNEDAATLELIARLTTAARDAAQTKLRTDCLQEMSK
jgi:hypothetical protein